MSTPTDVRFDLLLGGTWTPVTDDVRVAGGFAMSRGRTGEGQQSEPSTATLVADNGEGAVNGVGWASPRNPLSPFYGQLKRNTRCRISVPSDTYLDLPGTAGAKATAPDSAATSVTGDIDVRVDLTLSNWRQLWPICGKYETTGDQRSWALQLDATGLLTWYWSPDGTLAGRITVKSTVAVPAQPGRRALRATLDVNNGGGGWTVIFYTAPTNAGPWTQLGDPITGTGVTSVFDGTGILEVGEVPDFGAATVNSRVHIHAFELRNGIGGTAVANPNFAAQAAGATSFADTASSPNTWTVAGGAELKDRDYRFHGELGNLPPRWDLSGNDAWAPIEAAGIMRRLSTGTRGKPLNSTIRRALTGLAATPQQLLEYWPAEDLSGSTSLASAVGGKPMVIKGSPNLASFDGFKASQPLPVLNGSEWVGQVRGYAPTGVVQARFLLSVPADGDNSNWTVIKLNLTGTLASVTLTYTSGSGGGLTLNGYDSDANLLFSSGTDLGHNGELARWSIELVQNGANIDWKFQNTSVDNPYIGGGLIGTLNSRTVGAVTKVTISPLGGLDSTAIGHVSLHSAVTSILDVADELIAYEGEPAARRIARLCAEEAIAFQSIGGYGDLADLIGVVHNTAEDLSERMGPQRAAPLIDLLRDAADTDMGVLYEPRDVFGIGYRTRASMYNQTPSLALSAEWLADPPEPVDDDRLIRNDITVSREDGSSVRAEQVTGPLNTSDPDADPDGVGRYDTSETVSLHTDEQLVGQAGWKLNLGTVDEPRYPTMSIQLHEVPFTTDPQLRKQVLALIEGDLITLGDLPPGLPPDLVSQLTNGFVEHIGKFTHDLTINAVPGSPYSVGVWNEARYDTAGAELGEDLTTTEADVTVTTTSGPVWTTDPADLPFDVVVGGEVMRVQDKRITDTFTRSASNGWSNADTGEAWSTSGGAASDYSVTP